MLGNLQNSVATRIQYSIFCVIIGHVTKVKKMKSGSCNKHARIIFKMMDYSLDFLVLIMDHNFDSNKFCFEKLMWQKPKAFV